MKFNCSVTINKPRDFVVSKFSDPDCLVHWQDGFIGKKDLSGIPEKDGAVCELRYKMGRNELKLYETILRNKLPDSFYAEYECDPTKNTMLNTFTVIDENTTKYNVEVEYSKFNGFMLKLIKTIYPSMFKKQVQKWLNQFKQFVETKD